MQTNLSVVAADAIIIKAASRLAETLMQPENHIF